MKRAAFSISALALLTGLSCSSSGPDEDCLETCDGVRVEVMGWGELPPGDYLASICADTWCGAFTVTATESKLVCGALDPKHSTWSCWSDTSDSVMFGGRVEKSGVVPLRVFVAGPAIRTATGSATGVKCNEQHKCVRFSAVLKL